MKREQEAMEKRYKELISESQTHNLLRSHEEELRRVKEQAALTLKEEAAKREQLALQQELERQKKKEQINKRKNTKMNQWSPVEIQKRMTENATIKAHYTLFKRTKMEKGPVNSFNGVLVAIKQEFNMVFGIK